MKVELTRFRIKKGKETKAQEWMDFLNSHHEDTVATMAGERMYVENVFKEKNSDKYNNIRNNIYYNLCNIFSIFDGTLCNRYI